MLLESLDAKRLAVAWQYLKKDRGDEAWMKLAAVPRHRAQRHMGILRTSGVCRTDGTVDPLALQFISAHTMGGLRPATKGKPR